MGQQTVRAPVRVAFEDYVHGPRADAESATTFASQIDHASPSDLGTEGRKQLRLVTRTAAEVAAVLSERERNAPARVRPAMNGVIGAFSGLNGTLLAKAGLPVDVNEDAERAGEIQALIFPAGVAFANADAPTVHGASTRLLARIADEGLQRDVDRIVGPEFLVAIRKATNELGEMLRARGEKKPLPSSTALADALSRFSRAIGAYCRALMAETDEDDEASVARFMSAVAPIDDRRPGARTTDTTDKPDPTPTPTTTTPTTHAEEPTTHGHETTSTPTPTTSPGITPAPVVDTEDHAA
jgi:hypothetical protein